ncbi:hypothetical protein [Phaeobacter sp. HF9A]|uniref:hypothetical protein n=1 Tax=Phaeobacter sp. HF9A TaxID=2721561 RepID=UPI001430FFA9|nr:hypothetical protein [Phaeobacter sp. HF9A]NIZ13427.1 hypothetical protein [Phaeobacter sp. HF9A]
MATLQEEQTPVVSLPALAERYKAASLSASRQQLADAMAQLQKTAAAAVFPRAASADDSPTEAPLPPKRKQMAYGSVELAMMSKHSMHRTSEREASRLYAGAKTII